MNFAEKLLKNFAEKKLLKVISEARVIIEEECAQSGEFGVLLSKLIL